MNINKSRVHLAGNNYNKEFVLSNLEHTAKFNVDKISIYE